MRASLHQWARTCSWSRALLVMISWFGLITALYGWLCWLTKKQKQTTLSPPTKLTVRSKWISVSGGQWKGCVVRIEDRALPICFVQDKRTVPRLFIKRLCSQPVRGPGPARRYGMQGLALWLHAWRWRTWQCHVWPPTRLGALLWRHMHKVYKLNFFYPSTLSKYGKNRHIKGTSVVGERAL